MNAAHARHDPSVPDLRLVPPRSTRVALLDAAAWSPVERIPLSRTTRPVVDGPGEQDVKAALARILGSAAFGHSARHRSFLRYVVINTLAGRTRALKEVVIGLDVFERSLDRFDPRRDSIVRVEARRLRKKLCGYYAGEGRDDPVEIRLDVGGYVPCFLFRTPLRTDRATMPLVLVVPFVASETPAARIVAAALCDQLTDTLGTIAGIRVKATFGSSRAHSALDGPDTTVVPGGIDYVIDGSLIEAGSRWRCVAHLTSMHDGIRRWSETFDADPMKGAVDPFALQDRIATALRAAVRREVERAD